VNESLAQDMNAFVGGGDRLGANFPGDTVLVVQTRGAAAASRTLTSEKQKGREEAQTQPIPVELALIALPDGNMSRVVRKPKAARLHLRQATHA
jgi:hypothetical protein